MWGGGARCKVRRDGGVCGAVRGNRGGVHSVVDDADAVQERGVLKKRPDRAGDSNDPLAAFQSISLIWRGVMVRRTWPHRGTFSRLPKEACGTMWNSFACTTSGWSLHDIPQFGELPEEGGEAAGQLAPGPMGGDGDRNA